MKKHIKKQKLLDNKQSKKILHTNHHDQFFKFFFSKPELAQELFKLIFSKEELKAYDLTKLKAEQNSFVDGSSADLIFSLPLKNNKKSEIRIFILLEHKASYNVKVFEQLFRYQYLLIGQSLSEGKPLVPIIPVVFYHGKKPWEWKLSFQEALGSQAFLSLPLSFRESMLNFKIRLLDIQDKKWEWVFKNSHFQSRGVLYLLREVWSGQLNFKKVFSLFKEMLERQRDTEGIILNILKYLLKGYQIRPKLYEKMEVELVKEGLLKRGGYMDARDYFREEGRQEGWQKGQKEGWQEGRQEERQQVVLNMLKNKIDNKLISKVTGLSEEEIKKLKNGS